MSIQRGEHFLELGFDWYILENWDSTSTLSQRDQHIQLGLSYARLGHRGRRVYVQRADRYAWNPAEVPLSRPANSVPNDLLTPYERGLNQTYHHALMRTAFGLATDAQYAVILDQLNSIDPIEERTLVLDDLERHAYSSSGLGEELEAILAFVPVIIEFQGSFYSSDELEWESADMQYARSMAKPKDGDSANLIKARSVIMQRQLFVVDDEALATGYILWAHLDEFGQIVQRNRVTPQSVYNILAFREGLPDDKVGYVDGRLEGSQLRNMEGPYSVWRSL